VQALADRAIAASGEPDFVIEECPQMRRVALILVILLQACASDEVRPLRPDEIATASYHAAGAESLVGSLMYEGGCLMFVTEDGTRQLLPVWPTGSRLEESLVTFHQPAKADQRLTVGEEIKIDGAAGEWAQLDQRQFASFQHQCPAQPFFVSGVTPAN
jgi:hypothetical protein